MKLDLQSPAPQASTADWKSWAEELREMASTPQVKAAMRQADQVLASRRQSRRQSPTSFRSEIESMAG